MQAVADDVFYSIYQYLGFGMIFAVICMIAEYSVTSGSSAIIRF